MEEIALGEIKLKDFRSIFKQMCLDMAPIFLSDVSKQLGDSTKRTMEKHYGRIRDSAAFRTYGTLAGNPCQLLCLGELDRRLS